MLREKEYKMKSCVKFVCSKVKKPAAAWLTPCSRCRLGNCLQRRKGICYEMGRTQFTEYILVNVFPLPHYLKRVLSQGTLILCLSTICSSGSVFQTSVYKMLCTHKSNNVAARHISALIPFYLLAVAVSTCRHSRHAVCPR